jgi:sodium-dependent dicarboxylate transporter 2/3/5
MKSFISIIAGPLVGLLAFLLLRHLGTTQAAIAGSVVWMSVWWITEAVPIPITSLLPIVLFPLFGIAELGATTAYYGKDVIFLFLGGFLLALGIERSGLHRRLALMIVARVGAPLHDWSWACCSRPVC